MKNASPFLALLIAASLAGCGKSDPDTTSSSTTTGSSTTATTSTTAGIATATTSGTTATTGTAPTSTTTTGTTTSSTPTSVPSTAPTAPSKASTGDTGSLPSVGSAPPKSTPSAPIPPASTSAKPPTMGAPPQMNAQQKAQLDKVKAAIKKAGQEAEKATPSKIPDVDGTYKIDPTKLPPQAQKDPNLSQKLAAQPAWTFTGTDVVVQAGTNPQVTGFTTKVNGKTGLVLNVNSPMADAPKRIFIPIPFSADGKSFVFRGLTFTKQK